jgi:hypothetical protein
MASEIQKWWFIRPGSSSTMIDFGAAAWDMSTKVSFCQRRVIVDHFLTNIAPIKNIFQRRLGVKIFSRCWVLHFRSPGQEPFVLKGHNGCCEFDKNPMQTIWRSCNGWWVLISMFLFVLHNVCTIASRDHSEDPTGKLWSQYSSGHGNSSFSTFCHRRYFSPVVFYKWHFSGFEKCEPECLSADTMVGFLEHIDNSMWHNRSKMVSKFEKHPLSRSYRQPYSPGISLFDC